MLHLGIQDLLWAFHRISHFADYRFLASTRPLRGLPRARPPPCAALSSWWRGGCERAWGGLGVGPLGVGAGAEVAETKGTGAEALGIWVSASWSAPRLAVRWIDFQWTGFWQTGVSATGTDSEQMAGGRGVFRGQGAPPWRRRGTSITSVLGTGKPEGEKTQGGHGAHLSRGWRVGRCPSGERLVPLSGEEGEACRVEGTCHMGLVTHSARATRWLRSFLLLQSPLHAVGRAMGCGSDTCRGDMVVNSTAGEGEMLEGGEVGDRFGAAGTTLGENGRRWGQGHRGGFV